MSPMASHAVCNVGVLLRTFPLPQTCSFKGARMARGAWWARWWEKAAKHASQVADSGLGRCVF